MMQLLIERVAYDALRPGWFTNLYVFDLLDNTVEQDIDATGSHPASLVTTYAYDANQNLTRITKPQGNIVEYDYDERDLRIAERVGRDDALSEPGAVTIYFYDRNGNLEDVIGPSDRGVTSDTELTATIEDAFGSGDPLVHTGDWLVENIYDGFDRVIEVIDAVGNVANSFHDPGGRTVESNRFGPVGGTTPTDRDGDANEELAEGFTRFDEAGRAYESQQTVLLADGTTVPSTRTIIHNGGGLEANSTTNGHTDPADLTGNEESYVLTRTVHDAAGRVVITAQDNTALTHMTYDGAGRMLTATDALDNVVTNTYDGNGNVIHVTRTEKCTITLPADIDDEVFESAMFYDCLNRLVVSASQGADGFLDADFHDAENQTLFTLIGYDSRGNTVVTIDPKRNTAIAVYDGASRPVESHQHLRKLGEGNNPPEANKTFLAAGAGVIRTITFYDGNSRVRQLVDDRGAPTNYTYDTLDRQLTMVFQDGSTRTNEYNEAGDVTTYTDENGSVFEYDYDPIGRRTACAITPASGVAGNNGGGIRGTTAQAFEYDGLSRMTLATDTTTVNSASGQDADVVTVYDSLSRVLEEAQSFGNDRYVTNSAFTSYPTTQFTFPDDREVSSEYDALYRRTLVKETGGTDIASWKFFGPGRVAEIQLGAPGSGLICSFMNNDRTHSAVQANVSNPGWGDDDSDRLGYDGAGRMITKRFLAGGIDGGSGAYDDPTAVVGFTTSFDKSSNKLYERHLHSESRSHLYQPRDIDTGAVSALGYDSADRLRQYQRGVMNDGSGGGQGTVPGGAVATAITLPNAKEQQAYTLDGLGNWKNTAFTPVGDPQVVQRRDHNYLNQITATSDDGDPKTLFTYDGATGASNGNLKNDGVRAYVYDSFNRLAQVKKDPNGSPTLIGTYTYDALGRRIRKVVTNGGLPGGIPNGTTDCIYTGWRVIQDSNPLGGGGSTDTPIKQFVWGIYLDQIIQQKNLAALNNFGVGDELYPLQDLLYRTTGLADDAGTVREAYDTDAYGNTLVFRNSGTPPAVIDYDDSDTQVDYPTCDMIFTGQRWDAESAIYYYRYRYYCTSIARFISRDSIEYTRTLNLFEYTSSSPLTSVDPMGLWLLGDHTKMVQDALKALPCRPCHNTDSFATGLTEGVAYPDIPEGKLAFAQMYAQMLDNPRGWEEKWKDRMTYQTHYGDLQWWHAMQSTEATADELRKKMLKRALEISTLAINLNRRGTSSEEAGVDVCNLIGHNLGQLIHTIQDSYSRGHVERDKDFNILRFHNYKLQSGSAHKKADQEVGGKHWKEAVRIVSKFMDMILCKKEKIENVEKFFVDEVWPLHSDAKVGGTSDEFKKNPWER